MSTGKNRGRFTAFTVDNSWIGELPAKPAGVLRLGPGKLDLAVRLSACFRGPDNWFCVTACEVRLNDKDGRVWQATSRFYPDWLLYGMIDLSRKQPPRWLRKGPPEWREALKKRTLVRGLTYTFDDRFWRCFWINGTGIPIDFKYLGGDFDIAALNSDHLVVSAKQLFGSWNPMPLEADDGSPLPLPPPPPPPPRDEEEEMRREEEEEALRNQLDAEGESGDYDHMPDIAYELPVGKLLWHNTAVKEEEGWTGWTVPRPLVFERVRGKGQPQAPVVFLPEKNPAPSLLVPVTSQEDFLPVEWESYYSFELLTDAGGVLRATGEQHTWQVRLDVQPGSVSEPVDVLRWRSRITDNTGDVWEGVALFTPDVFLEKWIDLDRISLTALEGTGAGEEAESPEDEKPAVPLLHGIRGLVDDGGWRYVILAGEVIAFHGRNQNLTVDTSLAGAEVEVRLSGLVGRRRPIDILWSDPYVELDPEDRRDELPRWQQDQALPAVLYRLPFRDLAFHNTSFAVDDGFWHNNAIPIPVVFRRIGKAAPAAGVRFVPGAP